MKRESKNLLAGSTTLLVLSLLAGGDKYGYEMIAALEVKSDHTFSMKEGTLYPILTRQKNQGLLSYRWEESPQGPPRKYYSITDKGREALSQLDVSWDELIAQIAQIRGR